MKREEKLIGASLDAKVYIYTQQPQLQQLLKDYEKELGRIFIVSQIHLSAQKTPEYQESECSFTDLTDKVRLAVSVMKADGDKCPRCWVYSTEIGKDVNHPSLCPKCTEAVKGS